MQGDRQPPRSSEPAQPTEPPPTPDSAPDPKSPADRKVRIGRWVLFVVPRPPRPDWRWRLFFFLVVLYLVLRPHMARAADLGQPERMLLNLPMLCNMALSLLMLMHPRTRRVLFRGAKVFALYMVFVLLLFLADRAVHTPLGAFDGVLWTISPWVFFLVMACGLITLP